MRNALKKIRNLVIDIARNQNDKFVKLPSIWVSFIILAIRRNDFIWAGSQL